MMRTRGRGRPPHAHRNSEVRRLWSEGVGVPELMERFGVSDARIHQIVRPARYRARDAVRSALRRGEIERPDECQTCGAVGKIGAHHADYAKPLEVKWLCSPCHFAADLRDGTVPMPTAPNNRVLSDAAIRRIRDSYRAGESGASIAARMGISKTTAWAVGSGRRFSHV